MYIEKKNALKILYYTIAIDGSPETVVEEQELARLDQVGNELLGDRYIELRDAAIDECTMQIAGMQDGDVYTDVIAEGVDSALAGNKADQANGIDLNKLLWNMIVMAYSDNDYADAERRLLLHVVRTQGTDRDMFLEMEKIYVQSISLNEELTQLSRSDQPYSQVQAEIEQKKADYQALSDRLDEITGSTSEKKKESRFKDKSIEEIVDPIADGVMEKAGRLGEKLEPWANNAQSAAAKIWERLEGKNNR